MLKSLYHEKKYIQKCNATSGGLLTRVSRASTPRRIAIQVFMISQQSVKEKIPGCTDTNKSQQSVKEKIPGRT